MVIENLAFPLVLLLLTTFQTAGTEITDPIASAFNEFVASIGSSLPQVIAALILLGIGYLVGKVAGRVVRFVSEKLNLDSYWNKTGMGEAVSRAGWSITKILSTASKWFIFLFFISAALNVLQFTQLSEAINSVWLWIPNVIAFLVVLIVGALIADFAGRWMQRELPARGVAGGKTIALAATGILYAIVLVVATSQLGIGEEILNSVISALVWGLAAAVAIGVGVGLAYGLKEAVPSMITGHTLIQPTLKPGQRISYNGHTGNVQQVGSFSIILKDDEGRTIVIPTRNVADKEIIIESGPAPETQESSLEKKHMSAA
ncbi:MAG TPA: mechanosensitive ion channel domain-containing protein [Nitrososphaera sp.]|nr:mechanosensitive ion channel domain-containing protein [Nitrososphaera sp.]